RIRTIVEDVTEVPATARAGRLCARHEEGAVGLGCDRGRIGWCEETRPAGARLELRIGSEELGLAAGTAIDAGLVLIPELTAEGSLGSLLPQDAVLLRGQLSSPLRVRLGMWGDGLRVTHAVSIGPLRDGSMSSGDADQASAVLARSA